MSRENVDSYKTDSSSIYRQTPLHCDSAFQFMHSKFFIAFFVVLIQVSLALPAVPEAISCMSSRQEHHHNGDQNATATVRSQTHQTASSVLCHQTSSAPHCGNGSDNNGNKHNRHSPQGSSNNGSDILGATYFITNKANNTIIVSSIGADGKLTFAREVETGGGGRSASGEADALFSQDSIIQVDGVCFLTQNA
jgi:hypothetical protein